MGCQELGASVLAGLQGDRVLIQRNVDKVCSHQRDVQLYKHNQSQLTDVDENVSRSNTILKKLECLELQDQVD